MKIEYLPYKGHAVANRDSFAPGEPEGALQELLRHLSRKPCKARGANKYKNANRRALSFFAGEAMKDEARARRGAPEVVYDAPLGAPACVPTVERFNEVRKGGFGRGLRSAAKYRRRAQRDTENI